VPEIGLDVYVRTGRTGYRYTVYIVFRVYYPGNSIYDPNDCQSSSELWFSPRQDKIECIFSESGFKIQILDKNKLNCTLFACFYWFTFSQMVNFLTRTGSFSGPRPEMDSISGSSLLLRIWILYPEHHYCSESRFMPVKKLVYIITKLFEYRFLIINISDSDRIKSVRSYLDPDHCRSTISGSDSGPQKFIIRNPYNSKNFLQIWKTEFNLDPKNWWSGICIEKFSEDQD